MTKKPSRAQVERKRVEAAHPVVIPGPLWQWIRSSYCYKITGNEREAVLFLLRKALESEMNNDMNRKLDDAMRIYTTEEHAKAAVELACAAARRVRGKGRKT